MTAAVPDTPVPARRRHPRLLAATGTILVLLLLAIAWLLQPRQLAGLLLGHAGAALGLRISASRPDYRLLGTPSLVLHDVVAQRPGDPTPLLRAGRVFVALPWRTLRSRGAELAVQRLELDAPVLDVPALQRWLATRPAGETRIPVLHEGLRIRGGRIDNDDWRIDGIEVALPSLAPDRPAQAHIAGRYHDPPLRIPFDLEVAMTRPANDAGIAAIGSFSVEGDGWSLPAHVRLSGPLHLGDDEVRVAPARLGLAARYRSGDTDLPFVLGAHGLLLFDEGVWSLDPAWLVLRGREPIPDAVAQGALALGRRLVLRLHGDIAAWPEAWPALPPPLSDSRSPLGFAVDYVGGASLDDPASLLVRRDDARFEAGLRLPAVLAWLDDTGGSPLPPLRGRLQAPRLDIAGARLEGVELELDESAQ